eukprot:1461147-Amphidinium_carterae.1
MKIINDYTDRCVPLLSSYYSTRSTKQRRVNFTDFYYNAKGTTQADSKYGDNYMSHTTRVKNTTTTKQNHDSNVEQRTTATKRICTTIQPLAQQNYKLRTNGSMTNCRRDENVDVTQPSTRNIGSHFLPDMKNPDFDKVTKLSLTVENYYQNVHIVDNGFSVGTDGFKGKCRHDHTK